VSTWRALTIPGIDGVPEAVSAAETAASTLSDVLSTLAGLIDALSSLVSALADPLQAAIAALLEILQDLVDSVQALLASGVYFYLDKGPYFMASPADGLAGFIRRFTASFDDQGDAYRPMFPEGTPLSAMLIAVGADSLASFSDMLDPLARLFGIPSLFLAEAPGASLSEDIEVTMSEPPDWRNATLQELLPPMTELVESLQAAIGALAVPQTYADMLTELAALIGDKAIALQDLADNIQAAADDLQSIIDATGIYQLVMFGTSVDEIIAQVEEATDAPDWTAETWVAGVCLLGASSDFGPVFALLGGGGD